MTCIALNLSTPLSLSLSLLSEYATAGINFTKSSSSIRLQWQC